MQSYLPRTGYAFSAWGQNFKDKCFTDQVTLGLSPAEFTSIEDAANAYTAAFDAVETTKLAYEGAVAAKRLAHEAATEIFQTFAMEFKANPNLTPELKASLGLKVNPTPSGPVQIPTNLTATAFTNGTIKLRWDRNGNAQKTMFKIQAQFEGETQWQIIDTITATRYTVQNVVLGQPITFRIIASRGGANSDASNAVGVFTNDIPVSLEVAA